MDQARRLEYLPLEELVAAPRNPKGHDLGAIRASIARFGVASPAVRDERTGRLVVGHGRTEVLARMQADGETPPAGIHLDGQRWLVPVVCGWSSRSDAEAEAYLVADNQHTVIGGWNEAELGAMLGDLAALDPDLMGITGFTDADLAALMAKGRAGSVADPDEAPPVSDAVEPGTAYGDVWSLGPHRLLVGDATIPGPIQVMLDGDICDCMWTDPPYGVDYVGKTKDQLKINGDTGPGAELSPLLNSSFAAATTVLRAGAPIYLAHPDSYRGLFQRAFTDAGWTFRQNLIWVKDILVLGHADYHYRHEPVLYGFTGGLEEGRHGRGGDRWLGDNCQTTVFEFPKPSRSTDHPTMKPVALIEAMLRNSCPPGGLVYDPFAGSGSTLIAAHQLGQSARLVEIDPRYADVILKRWTAATGEDAKRLSDGASWTEICDG